MLVDYRGHPAATAWVALGHAGRLGKGRPWWESWPELCPGGEPPALLGTGPLTNLALVLSQMGLSPVPARLVVMGGSFASPGAEANFAADPASAAAVMDSCWEPILVPLDVTRPLRASLESVRRMAQGEDELVSFCGRALGSYAEQWWRRRAPPAPPFMTSLRRCCCCEAISQGRSAAKWRCPSTRARQSSSGPGVEPWSPGCDGGGWALNLRRVV